MRALLVVVLLLFAGCAQTSEEPLDSVAAMPVLDPLAPGNHTVHSQLWENSVTVVTGAELNGVPMGVYPVELRGTMHVPERSGPAPVLLFMHGRHSTCEFVGTTEFLAPAGCPDAPPVSEPVRNARGYEYLGEFLASHGFFVISVNANNVNDNDLTWSLIGDDSGATARAQIVGEVLRDLDTATKGRMVGDWPDLTDRLDMNWVGLMGHSRGGEGVVAAQALSQSGDLNIGPTHIRGVFALAPTDFQHWEIKNTAFATILPYCDGDVSNLQGAWMYDENRHNDHTGFYQFTVLGANHNFYNTVWTNDDFGNRGDPWCDMDNANGGRLSPEEQQDNGIMLMATFFRAHVGQDEAWLPMLQGRDPWPLEGTATSYHAPDARDWDEWVGNTTVGFSTCVFTDCPGQIAFPAAMQQHVEWTGPAQISIPNHVETARFNLIPGTDAGDKVYVTTPDGRWSLAELGAVVPPGESHARSTLNMVVLPAGEGRMLELTGSGELLTADWL